MTRFSVYQPRDFAGDGAHPAALVLRWSGIGSGTAGRLTEPPFHEIEDLPACPDSYEHVFRQAFVETPLSPQRLGTPANGLWRNDDAVTCAAFVMKF